MSASAAGVDDVLAMFRQHIGLGTVELTLVEEWHTVGRPGIALMTGIVSGVGRDGGAVGGDQPDLQRLAPKRVYAGG